MKERSVFLFSAGLLLAGFVLAGFPSLTVFAAAPSQMDQATAAFARKDYAAALTLLRGLAAKGDAEAETALGLMYQQGHGVGRDYAAAMTWYRRAAQQDNAFAEYRLGLLYKEGLGTRPQPEEAFKWFLRAAQRGSTGAQKDLGEYYETGLPGVKQDYEEAYFWELVASDTDDSMIYLPYTREASRHLNLWQALKVEARAEEWQPAPPKDEKTTQLR